jgi:hypothetical protein
MGRYAVVLALLARIAVAQQDGRGLLKQVAATFTHVRGYELEAVITRGSNAPKRIEIAYSAPDHLMLQDKSTSLTTSYYNHGIGTFDGVNYRFQSFAHPAASPAPPGPSVPGFKPEQGGNKVCCVDDRWPNMPQPRNEPKQPSEVERRNHALIAIGFPGYAGVSEHLQSARILREEAIRLEGVAIPCAVVQAAYPYERASIYWVDKARHVVLRQQELKGGGGPDKSTVYQTTEIVKLSWGSALPDSRFDFQR